MVIRLVLIDVLKMKVLLLMKMWWTTVSLMEDDENWTQMTNDFSIGETKMKSNVQ